MLGCVSRRILIAGCGYLGSALGVELAREGHEVWGLRRGAWQAPAGIRPLQADLTRTDSLSALPEGIDTVFYTAAAGSRDPVHYREVYLDGVGNLVRALAELGERPRRFLYTSSTSVYAQHRGEWVDEESVTRPTRETSEIVLLGERLLRSSGEGSVVLRLGGLYGPQRTGLVERVRRGEARLRPGPRHYTNRIHRDDAVAALLHLMELTEPAPIYLGVDSEPSDEAEVYRWLAQRLAVEPPQPAGPDEAPRTRAGSKRCSNERLRATGFHFRYPSYREGYEALLAGSD